MKNESRNFSVKFPPSFGMSWNKIINPQQVVWRACPFLSLSPKVLCLVWIIKQMSPYYFGSLSICLDVFYICYKSSDDRKRMERIRLLVQLFGFFGGHNYLFHQITSFLGTELRLWFSILSGMERNLLFFSLSFFLPGKMAVCSLFLTLFALRNKKYADSVL